ncbi:unnamed protein product [Cylicocyclus nassatus]|uniref:Uncharacterized protein n=1 Tax=Cylicocyclus nassatus TaxID=53992 RepID=A0AA36H0Y6_CYLNA|nr:unnamed protein product [Cylicocyclus nassatus]
MLPKRKRYILKIPISLQPSKRTRCNVEAPANINANLRKWRKLATSANLQRRKTSKNDIFNEDPCMVSHSCLPINRYGDKANRHGYQACQALRKDKHAYKTTPYRHFSETAQNILNELWKTIDDRRKVLGKFHGDSYEHKRKTFANKLRGMLSRRISPPFEELLKCLHSINSVSFGTLYNVKEDAQASKVLRRKDQQRRDKINQEMAEFKQLFTSSVLLHTDIIIDYCRKMSRFVTEKTI